MTRTVTNMYCGAGGSSHGGEPADFRAECHGVCGG
jgi:hypothetical protein